MLLGALVAGATTEKQAVDRLTFADHTVCELKVRTCNVRLITPLGRQQLFLRSIGAWFTREVINTRMWGR